MEASQDKQAPKLPRWDEDLFKAQEVPKIDRSLLAIKAEREENLRFAKKDAVWFDMGEARWGKRKKSKK